MNQYVAYPSVSIVLGALWIAYTTFLYRMFGGAHADPKPLYFWIPVLWIPFYLSMSTTTFSVLSGANLVSKGRKPNTHRLGPWTANGLLVLLPLAMVVAISCAVGYTGMKWRNFGRSWEAAHAGIGVLADQWTGSYDAAAEAVANQLVKTR